MPNPRTFGKIAAACAACAATAALATPSTIIWIPSVDIQPYKTMHVTADTYIRAKNEPGGANLPPIYDFGLTWGILPFEQIQAEAGFDVIYGGANTAAGLDKFPAYFNFKIGTPEDDKSWKPAVAVGAYNLGTKRGDARRGQLATDQNIVYGIVGKTVPLLGRFEAGYYVGNRKVLVKDTLDAAGNLESANKGVLLSWDRAMVEISDKLWFGVDYQGGRSAMGALNIGFAWTFAKNVSVIFAYDRYNNKKIAGQNTATIQVDINWP